MALQGRYAYICLPPAGLDAIEPYLEAFDGAGVKMWFDTEGGGMEERMERALPMMKACDFVLLFYNGSAYKNEVLYEEFVLARYLEKPVFLLYTEDAPVPEGWQESFGQHLVVPLYKGETRPETLARAVGELWQDEAERVAKTSTGTINSDEADDVANLRVYCILPPDRPDEAMNCVKRFHARGAFIKMDNRQGTVDDLLCRAMPQCEDSDVVLAFCTRRALDDEMWRTQYSMALILKKPVFFLFMARDAVAESWADIFKKHMRMELFDENDPTGKELLADEELMDQVCNLVADNWEEAAQDALLMEPEDEDEQEDEPEDAGGSGNPTLDAFAREADVIIGGGATSFDSFMEDRPFAGDTPAASSARREAPPANGGELRFDDFLNGANPRQKPQPVAQAPMPEKQAPPAPAKAAPQQKPAPRQTPAPPPLPNLFTREGARAYLVGLGFRDMPLQASGNRMYVQESRTAAKTPFIIFYIAKGGGSFLPVKDLKAWQNKGNCALVYTDEDTNQAWLWGPMALAEAEAPLKKHISSGTFGKCYNLEGNLFSQLHHNMGITCVYFTDNQKLQAHLDKWHAVYVTPQ